MNEQNYKDSPEWQKAFELVKEVSALTQKLAKSEDIPERAQHVYNRYAESIALNIAEAAGLATIRGGSVRNLSEAAGATFRLETKLLLDTERNYLPRSDIDAALKLCAEIGALLTDKLNKLEAEREARLSRRSRPCDDE